MTKIVSCASTQDNTYSPPAGSKLDKCNCCKTFVWLPKEMEAAKTSGREVWCNKCVDAKATPQDDIFGKSIHNSGKAGVGNQNFSTLDERFYAHQKEIQETILKDVDNQLGLIASVAINNLAPTKDSEHLLLACVVRMFLEQRLLSLREDLGPSATLVDVMNRFENHEKINILTFIIGTYHATKTYANAAKFPSWNRKDNGQDEEYEKSKDKSWEWEQ